MFFACHVQPFLQSLLYLSMLSLLSSVFLAELLMPLILLFLIELSLIFLHLAHIINGSYFDLF